jgi:hypothetical protein
MDILWPVDKGYLPIQKHFEGVKFVDKDTLKINYKTTKFEQTPEGLIVPLYMAHDICRVRYKDVMKSKYILFGGDWKTWRSLKWKRDTEAEARLFYDVLGLKDGEEYSLVNTRFRTDQTGGVKIAEPKGRVITMRNIEGYTMLDWGKVMEKATTIHTVGTSINYAIEMLSCEASEIHLYVRKPDERDFSYYDYILTDKYKYIFHK